MEKGNNRLDKELDMCRIVEELKKLQEESGALQNIIGAQIKKEQIIDIDKDSESETTLFTELRKSLTIKIDH